MTPRSRLSVTRDVAAIVRDVLIILVIVASLVTAAQVIKAIQPHGEIRKATVPTCVMLDPNDNDRCLVDGG